ncbi:hypothetical protein NQD34_005172 [Periophthalmus magnuspinnatus]|nr:hypothetical protein NQD34_005172 [Periophthalmus magnuspinnatus]
MIESSSENTMMTSVFATSGSYYTWIGLYRETLGIWSDGTSLTFTRWGAIGTGQQCVAEDSAHLWFPQSCDQTLPFFCHGAKKMKSKLVQMKFCSGLDMSDPNNYTKMLQQVEEHFKEKRLTDISITIKSSPQKSNSKKQVETCT